MFNEQSSATRTDYFPAESNNTKHNAELVGLIDLVFGGQADASDQDAIEYVDEKRREARQCVLLPAVIFSDALGPYRCVIRELSTSGARITISRTAKLVPEMWIKISGKRSRSVICVWRKADFVGLQLK